MREAPSAVIAARLLAEGATVTCWDPMAPRTTADHAPWTSVTRHPDPLTALTDADAAILVTEWPELTELDWPTAARTMRTPLLLDGRNLLDPTPLLAAGFTHMSVGRPTHRPT